ncbi:tyrosine-type recombinase/integrase [Paenibacillus tyrfis]|uniref:tyrosine-type recombinase/integrase n=1 Tax=Paenibacillus tyrfis TaxID=1501230 RepID=UPI0038993714
MSVADRFFTKEEFVFVNSREIPGYPETILRVELYMKKILQNAKLPSSLTPHSLRHTYTNLMAEAGVELSAIQRLLGHINDDLASKSTCNNCRLILIPLQIRATNGR